MLAGLTIAGLASIITLVYFGFVASNFFPAKNALEKGQGYVVIASFEGQAPDIERAYSEPLPDRRPVFDGKVYSLPGNMLGEMKYGDDVIDRLTPGRTYKLLVYKKRILRISGPVQ